MKSITQYLYELFINNEKPLTLSQYLSMLSMLWLLSSFYFIDLFSGTINTFLMSARGVGAGAELIMLPNIIGVFLTSSVPWGFASLVLAFFCVKRVYKTKSMFTHLIMAWIVYVFFRLLLMSSMLVSGNFDSLWTAAGGLQELQEKIDILKVVWLVIFILGLAIVIYPLFNLTDDNHSNSQTSKGFTRERFAKITLYINILFLFIGLILIGLIHFNLIKFFHEYFIMAVLAVFSMLMITLGIYLIGQRLKNANKSYIRFFFIFLGLLAIPISGGLIAWYIENTWMHVLGTYLIVLGLGLSKLFICYLYLIPESNISNT